MNFTYKHFYETGGTTYNYVAIKVWEIGPLDGDNITKLLINFMALWFDYDYFYD